MASIKGSALVHVHGLVLGALLLIASSGLQAGAMTTNEKKGSIVAYWGQGADPKVEGSLASACSSGDYKIVIIGFLATFGGYKPPRVFLTACDGTAKACTYLSNDITHCQKMGVKVLISMGGDVGNYGFVSSGDAQEVANYLWHTYFGGLSNSRPFGVAALDGLDLNLQSGSPLYYDVLVQTLRNLATTWNWSKHIYLSAAPRCSFPDAWVGPGSGTALQTGMFDYIFVQFYNSSCQFNGDVNSAVQVWNQWTSALPNATVFFGLPAAPGAGSGFVSSHEAVTQLLPEIKAADSRNYGGVMLWSIFWDKTQKPTYSETISPAL